MPTTKTDLAAIVNALRDAGAARLVTDSANHVEYVLGGFWFYVAPGVILVNLADVPGLCSQPKALDAALEIVRRERMKVESGSKFPAYERAISDELERARVRKEYDRARIEVYA